MKEEEDDFGFSIVDESEIPRTDNWEKKFNDLKKMIMPLLENLMANPEKDYILWPNRVEKIKSFISKMDKL
jgi:hypothetical protein